ncbi:PREDICTED: dnaJ [Prunus dulcis]|uniref:PREDICTED: dnaJ n=1 Tax=Prunus dulcis TaxID=3755 RepID=A0A5E4G013_PRUDU|nr:hypothetical protein L3X38_036641 [Prunus dulcis]VVA33069.1 PREDICTED: dnaJ [Prunus dulcis]
MSTTKECNGDAGSSSDRRQQCFGGKVWSLEVPPEFICVYLLESGGKIETRCCFGWGGIGAVIRNDKGEAMAAMALPFETPTSTKHAKIMALQFMLNFAWDGRFSSVMLESDSQAVISSINSEEDESFAPEGHLIDAKGTKIACPDKGNEQLGQLPADLDFVIDHEKPHDTYKRDGKSPHCDPQGDVSGGVGWNHGASHQARWL